MRASFSKVILLLGCCFATVAFAQSGKSTLQNVVEGVLGTTERPKIDRLETFVDGQNVRFVISGD